MRYNNGFRGPRAATFVEATSVMVCVALMARYIQISTRKFFLCGRPKRNKESIRSSGMRYQQEFYTAAKLGDIELLRDIMRLNASTGTVCEESNKMALMYAARSGCLSSVKFLTARYENLNELFERMRSVLMVAVNTGRLDIVRWVATTMPQCLVYTDSIGRTALHTAATDNHPLIVEFLLSRPLHLLHIDERDDFGRTALMLAAQNGHSQIVACLLEKGACCRVQDQLQQTALMFAAETGHLQAVRCLLRSDTIHADLSDRFGRTALMLAARKGKLDIMHALVVCGATHTSTDAYGRTVLQYAIDGDFFECLQWLVEHGVDPERKDACGRTALMSAVKDGRLEMVKWMAQKNEASLFSRDLGGRTSFLLAAKYGHLDVIRWIAGRDGLDPSVTDSEGRTALMLAVSSERPGHLDVVRWLLRQGGVHVDLSNVDNGGSSVWELVNWPHGSCFGGAVDSEPTGLGRTLLLHDMPPMEWRLPHFKRYDTLAARATALRSARQSLVSRMHSVVAGTTRLLPELVQIVCAYADPTPDEVWYWNWN